MWVSLLLTADSVFGQLQVGDGNHAANELRAGVARRVVTPPLGVPFLTSSGRGTNRPFEGVHDNLYARALVLDDGQRAIAVLAVDAIGYDNSVLGPGRDFTRELRELIAERTELKADAVMLAATHTHQAPETIGLTPLREVAGTPGWLEEHLKDLAAVVIEAWQKRVHVRAFAGSVRVPGVSRNRRIVLKDGTSSRRGGLPPADKIAKPFAADEELAVLYFETDNGAPHSVLLNFTAHPVVTMLLPSVSADFCGAACKLVEQKLPGAVCLFTQGAAGNVNSLMVSTSFDDAQTLGYRLGEAALGEIQRRRDEKPLAMSAVHYQREEIVLDGRQCPSLPDAERAVAERPTAENQQLLRLARKLAEGPIRTEVQAMCAGDVRWVSLPGEAFVETGLALKKAGASFVVGYANGYVGYIPVRTAYADGGYETSPGVWSRVAPGSAERIEEVGSGLLQQLRKRSMSRDDLATAPREKELQSSSQRGQGNGTEPSARGMTDALPRLPPKDAAEAAKTFEVLHGFRMELIASEPLVTGPVALAYDENGRAYVAEMRDYPYTDKETHEPWRENLTDLPIGRVSLLEDHDGDGRFDSSSVFADQLSWPTGITCWKGGVFVAATPDIWYFKDTDGDCKADVRQKVYTGFRKYNVQAVINNLTWGFDNWIYGAGSTNGGSIRLAENGAVNRAAERTPVSVPAGNLPYDPWPVILTANDFRFDPERSLAGWASPTKRAVRGAHQTRLPFEALSGGCRFGLTMDDWGNRFLCLVSHPARHVILPAHYVKRNRHLPVSNAVHDMAAYGDAVPVYPISPPEPWRALRGQRWTAEAGQNFLPRETNPSGYFTGASGLTMYRGSAYPNEYYGNLFIGEVANNLVHRMTLRPDGVTFVAQRADEQTEFVRSTDNWFRPVNLINAPDGTLHVLDMYREVIEHPWSIPDDIHEQLDLESGRERGRIWRLAPSDFRPPTPPRLGHATTAQLVKTLEHPNCWWRETAHRLLFEQQDTAAVKPLSELVRRSDKPESRLLALYALDGLGALDDAHLTGALADTSGPVRAHAVRLAEPRLAKQPALANRILALADDPDIRVRFQLAFTLGELDDSRAATALQRIARHDAGDGWVRTAVLSSSSSFCDKLLVELLADRSFSGKDEGHELLRHLAVVVGARNRPAETNATLDAAVALSVGVGLQPADALSASGRGLSLAQSAVLRGLGDGLKRSGKSLRMAARAGNSTNDKTGGALGRQKLVDIALGEASRTLTAAAATVEQRLAAIQWLSYDDFDHARPVLVSLLDARQPLAVQIEAVRTLGAFREPQVAGLLLERWRGFLPTLRGEVVLALLGRTERLLALLDAVAEGTVSPLQIPPNRRPSLLHHPDPAIRERAAAVLGQPSLSPRAEVIAKYRPALSSPADPRRGEAVFKRECMTCHRVGNQGYEVGPNLATIRHRTPEELLVQVLDPSREVSPQFLEYIVALTDGRIASGIIVSETPTAITLLRAQGAQETILRHDIDEISNGGKSIMPDGLEQKITPQEMADLLAHLLHPQ